MEEDVKKGKHIFSVLFIISLFLFSGFNIFFHGPVLLEEIKEKYGFDANAIVSMAEVTEYLYNKPYKGQVYIDDTLKTAIDAYYAQYGAK